MEDINNKSNIPKDSPSKKNTKEPQDSKPSFKSNILKNNNEMIEMESKQYEEKNKKIDEKTQKIKDETLFNEKTNQLIKFGNELDNILASIKGTWENYNQGFTEYYQKEIFPKFQEFLNYPCITQIQENIILIFKFLCKYFLSRQNFLKEIPTYEILGISIILFDEQSNNIFMNKPNISIEVQNYEIIGDKYFYQIFKELLPDKYIENTYGNLQRNCMYKYLIEFLFQCGFMDSYIDNILTRKDIIDPIIFMQISLYPMCVLKYCEKDFLLKKNYNIRIIKNFNEKIDFFLSNEKQYLKSEQELIKFENLFLSSFIDRLFSVFNHVLEELLKKYNIDCQNFSINFFKVNNYLIKHQKIAIKTLGIQNCGNICNIYNNFFKNINNYEKKYNNIDKIYALITKCAAYYLNKINIFDIIFGKNIHEALIQRSYSILSFLYRNKLFTNQQIQILWNLSQTKYQSISNSIITLFGQLLPEFSNEDCKSILIIVSKMNYKNVNETTLKLLENFFYGNERRQILLDILFKFSNELSYEQGLDKNIIIKSRTILVKLLFNINYCEDMINYIKKCIFNIQNFYLVNTYSSTLTQIFDEFERIKNSPKNNPRDIYKKIDNKIEDFGMMISYLDKNFKLFPVYMNYLLNVIKMFKYFYFESANIISQIEIGNFNSEQLFNMDKLYNDYKSFIKQNMNFHYNLSDEIDNGNNMEIDYDDKNNIINANENKNNTQFSINEIDYINYIKNIIKDFVIFFKETFISNNIIPSSNEELKMNIYEKLKIFFEKMNYNECVMKTLKTIFIIHQRANINFKISYLDFLFNIGNNTKDINPNIQWFYNLLSDLFTCQTNINYNLHLLSNENMEYIVNKYICKYESDYKILPISAFIVVNLFCIYVNQKKENAIYSPLTQKYTEIKNYENFYGFDIIYKFYLLTENEEIYKQALNVLMNILELTSQNVQNRNNLINKIFNFIEQNKNNIQNNKEFKIAFIRNLKLISVVNGSKSTENIFNVKDGQNTVELTIKNFYFNSNNSSDNITKINLSKEMKIKALKEYLINKIICTENNLNYYNEQVKFNNNLELNRQNNLINQKEEPNGTISSTSNINNSNIQNYLLSIDDLKKEVYKTNIIINYKTSVLKDDYTLADYNIANNDSLIIMKGSGQSEGEYKPTEEELQAGYAAIKMVFGENFYFNEEIMKASIIKHRGNPEDAALYLTVPENVKNLEKEIAEKKKGVEQKEDEIMSLEQEKINILIGVLDNCNDEEILTNIWQLFSEVKYPESFIQKIIKEEFSNSLNESNINKMIFYLKLINSLVFDDNFCKFNKIKKEQKSNWIMSFMKNENIIKLVFTTLSEIDKKLSNNNQIYQILNIFINWFHKIILKISEIMKENGTTKDLLPEIKKLRQYNQDNNISNNNTIINENENKKKESEEFEFLNKDEVFNFIEMLYKMNAIEK